MTAEQITTAAHGFIAGFDTNANRAIDLWRNGGERLGEFARARWDAALKESSPQLTAETRRNANHARDVFAGYYATGLQLSTGGAKTAVDTMVQVARVAVDRAAAWQQARA